MKRGTYFILLIVMVPLFAACAAPATPMPFSPTQTSSPVPTAIAAAMPTAAPAATATATSLPIEIKSIPGFENWSVNNKIAVDIEEQGDALVLALKRSALWYMDRQGVLAYTTVEGDFKITADVYTMKRSDPSRAPGGDGTVQLGGVMARNGTGARENYVFIVVGDNGSGLSMETKNTVDDFSEYVSPAWDSASASLRLCRTGPKFRLYKRYPGSDEPWIPAVFYDRPDLPASLQVGVNIYTNSAPDLQVRYENINIEPLASPEECEAN